MIINYSCVFQVCTALSHSASLSLSFSLSLRQDLRTEYARDLILPTDRAGAQALPAPAQPTPRALNAGLPSASAAKPSGSHVFVISVIIHLCVLYILLLLLLSAITH